MTENETITPKELKKILDLSIALNLLLSCTITDSIIKISEYDNWKIKTYVYSNDDKHEIFNIINGYYRACNSK